MSAFEKCIVKPGTQVDLRDISTDETFGWSEEKARQQTQENLKRVKKLQELLNCESKRGFLIVLQAMDAGGKDGTVKTLSSGLGLAGARAHSFKSPTQEELSHDFLWRVEKQLPKAGELVIFNRSHYEDVGIVRVHNIVPENVWRPRYEIIRDFEEKLTEPNPEVPEGTHVIKFFLHISKGEQKRRLLERMDNPEKNWKLDESDLAERAYWDDYTKAYSEAITQTSTEKAPWIVIPADNKWMRDLIISKLLVEHLEGLKMQFPKPKADIAALRRKYFPDSVPPKQPSVKTSSAKNQFNF